MFYFFNRNFCETSVSCQDKTVKHGTSEVWMGFFFLVLFHGNMYRIRRAKRQGSGGRKTSKTGLLRGGEVIDSFQYSRAIRFIATFTFMISPSFSHPLQMLPPNGHRSLRSYWLPVASVCVMQTGRDPMPPENMRSFSQIKESQNRSKIHKNPVTFVYIYLLSNFTKYIYYLYLYSGYSPLYKSRTL